MKLASLVAFLNGELSPGQFSDEIAPEVKACRAAMEATRCGHVFLTNSQDAPFESTSSLPAAQSSSELISGAPEGYGSIIDRRHMHTSVASGLEIVFARAHARRLLEAMAEQSLSLDVACYVADCILMGSCFDFEEGDELALEALHFAADDSPPRHTGEEIQRILNGLS